MEVNAFHFTHTNLYAFCLGVGTSMKHDEIQGCLKHRNVPPIYVFRGGVGCRKLEPREIKSQTSTILETINKTVYIYH